MTLTALFAALAAFARPTGRHRRTLTARLAAAWGTR